MMLKRKAVGPDGITFKPERLNANRAPNSRIVDVRTDTKAKEANFVLPNNLSIGTATLYSRISVNKSSLEFDMAK